MKPWLFVGAKVVCVDAAPPDDRPPILVQGEVYTVNWISGCGEGIRVKETAVWEWYIGFRLCRFRPLVDVSGTIEALRKLTVPTRETELVS